MEPTPALTTYEPVPVYGAVPPEAVTEAVVLPPKQLIDGVEDIALKPIQPEVGQG